jgi:adenylyl-sulfate kinase
MIKTKVIWFTGLSGSGKTTITEILVNKLEELGKSYVIFDGDDVRKRLHKHLGFTLEDIKENNRLIVELCREEFGKKNFIIIPVISPFRESRALARGVFGENFIEVFLDCDYEECKKRDVKGLYKKAENGEIENFIGLEVPYEKPEGAEVVLDVVNESAEESTEKLFGFITNEDKNGENYKNNAFDVDLQIHSTYSDGKFSPKEILDMALERGMKAIAITDHDTIGGIEEAIEYCKDKDIEFVSGVELSCKEEFYSGTIDVLGLFIDSENEDLRRFIKKDQKNRYNEKKEMIEKLKGLGYEISFNELLEKSGDSLGRPAIADILFKRYPEKFSSSKEVFEKLIGEGRPGFIHRDKVRIKDAVNIINKSGGVSVLAHPGRYIVNVDKVIDKFVENGGEAIEVNYPYKDLLRIGEEVENGWIEMFKKVAENRGLLISGGSDFHDFDRGSRIGDSGLSIEEFKMLKRGLK